MTSADKIINDPIKSTLFGKFYEHILLGGLNERGFTPCDGKPRYSGRKWNSPREMASARLS